MNISKILLLKNLYKNPNTIAFKFNDMKITYKELYKKVVFVSKNIDNKLCNSQVVLIIENSLDFIITSLALWLVGKRIIFVNSKLQTETINKIINKYDDFDIITNSKNISKINSSFSGVLYNYDKFESDSENIKDKQFIEVCPDSQSEFILHTSGSSGIPKGYLHDSNSILHVCKSYGEEILHLTESDILFSPFNMTFAYGLGNSLYLSMYYGATSIITENVDIFENLNTCVKEKPTVVFGIPYIYKEILKIAKNKKIDLKSVRMFVSAAEKMDITTQNNWKKIFNQYIVESFGSTELLHVYISNSLDDNNLNTNGKLLSGYKIKKDYINDKQFKLSISGSSKFKDSVDDNLKGNYFESEDIFEIEKDYLKFIGRSGSSFKNKGVWTDIETIRLKLNKNTSLRHVHIIKYQNGSELTINIFVVPKDSYYQLDKIKKNIKKDIREIGHLNNLNFKIYILDKLPRNANEKVNEKALRERYL